MAGEKYLPRVRTSTTVSYSKVAGKPGVFSETISKGTWGGGSVRRTYFSRGSVKTPGYRAIIASGGKLPVNGFTYETNELGTGVGTVFVPRSYASDRMSWSQAIHVYEGTPGTFMPTPLALDQRNAVVAKLQQKAKGMQWNVPVFLGEAKKTGNMVAVAATRIVNCARALKRGDVAGFVASAHSSFNGVSGNRRRRFERDFGKSPQSAFANAWLEWKYGWTPFMQDAENAVNTLGELAEREKPRIARVSANCTQIVKTLRKDSVLFSDLAVFGQLFGIIEEVHTHSARGTWRFIAKPLDLPGKLGLTNPAEVAWELVPFSFVADWFLPIGDYLAGFDVSSRFTHIDGSYGTKTTAVATSIVTHASNASLAWNGFGGRATALKVSRASLPNAPSQSLSAMKAGKGLDLTRVISATALLQQIFGGKRR